MGCYSEELCASTGDFVVQRADGPFAYHLAVVVDDGESGVNQVVRGADLLSSTPRQIYLQKLLGYETPVYYHLPLVTGPGGAKLSKRDNAVSLAEGRDLRREGGEPARRRTEVPRSESSARAYPGPLPGNPRLGRGPFRPPPRPPYTSRVRSPRLSSAHG
jgi:glutamyl/glutaminyl-tRNA synthetase